MKQNHRYHSSKRIRVLLFVCTILLSNIALGQLYKGKETFRMGILLGGNLSRTFGTELTEAKLKPGIECGIFYRQPLTKSLHLQLEVVASLRGSKYDHKGPNKQYTQLSTIYADVPLTILYDLQKTKQKHFLVFGLVPSLLLQSEFYISSEATSREEFRNEGISKYDAGILLGYLINTYYADWQFNIKMGFLNINNGIILPEILPVTGNGGNVHNFSLNLQVFF